jgi:hypothetical protein
MPRAGMLVAGKDAVAAAAPRVPAGGWRMPHARMLVAGKDAVAAAVPCVPAGGWRMPRVGNAGADGYADAREGRPQAPVVGGCSAPER